MPVSRDDRLDLAICPDSTKVTFKVFNSNSHTLDFAEVYIVDPAVVKLSGADVLVSGHPPRRSTREIRPVRALDGSNAARHQSAATGAPANG